MDEVDGDGEEGALDPRIQIELENLNTATDEINRLEIELDEANTTFRILLNECTRRLKQKLKSLGSCVDRARPYYVAVEVARQAQLECQRAAVQYQRANEIHQAAKETVALAEQRFLSKQHEWQFDNAWQEMLNHATIKVRDAETQKAESGREHHRRATLFNAAEQEVQQHEQRLHRQIIKSRPYFEEKALCDGQLLAQKERVESLQTQVAAVKSAYANSLKELERISEEIHCKRSRNKQPDVDHDLPCGPREPGVGAELSPEFSEVPTGTPSLPENMKPVKEVKENSSDERGELEPSGLPQIKEAHMPPNANVESKPSPSRTISALTPLPLLDNLTELKKSDSLEMLKISLMSPYRSVVTSTRAVDDFGSVCSGEKFSPDTSEGGDDSGVTSAYNQVLLTQLMDTYEPVLDCGDLTSLGNLSLATGSSAVSEKDESEVYIDGEELGPVQLPQMSLRPSQTVIPCLGNKSDSCHEPGSSVTSSPVKGLVIASSHTPTTSAPTLPIFPADAVEPPTSTPQTTEQASSSQLLLCPKPESAISAAMTENCDTASAASE